MKIFEVELKFQVLDKGQLKDFVKKLTPIGKRRVVDVYLDTKDGDLYRKGIFIRIRDNKTLDFKFNLEDFKNLETESEHEHCEEHSFSLPISAESLEAINQNLRILGLKEISSPDLEEFKKLNGFVESVMLDKIREKFRDEDFEYSVDDVKGLGQFMEIETQASEDQLEEIKEVMRENVKNLKLKLITTGYNELYWRKHNFDLYKQGRYFLEEDKGNF